MNNVEIAEQILTEVQEQHGGDLTYWQRNWVLAAMHRFSDESNSIEIRKWRELVENLKLDHSIEMNKLKVKEGEALKKAANDFDHLMKYMQCVESIVGFAGPIERVKQELDLIVGSRKDYLDYIDRARLGLCLVKEMIEDDKFDKDNALTVLEKALY